MLNRRQAKDEDEAKVKVDAELTKQVNQPKPKQTKAEQAGKSK